MRGLVDRLEYTRIHYFPHGARGTERVCLDHEPVESSVDMCQYAVLQADVVMQEDRGDFEPAVRFVEVSDGGAAMSRSECPRDVHPGLMDEVKG